MTHDIHQHNILIIDFGSQYTQLIARRVREIGVYCEIMPYDARADRFVDFKPHAIILSGGPESVYDPCDAPHIAPELWALNVPILGICYGLQAMVQALGGAVVPASKREYGQATLRCAADHPLWQGLDAKAFTVWMSHGDKVTQLPEDFDVIATTDHAEFAAIAHNHKPYFGLQFHPEVTHTEHGLRVLQNFVRDICQCDALWTSRNIIEDAIATIREQVGTERVILGLSGGVDSSVVAALLHQAIGDRLTCVFVDNGLLRLNEATQVVTTFREKMQMNLIHVDAAAQFLGRLAGVTDPEAKRKIIGELFIEIFEAEAAKISDAKWLAQGTIYPDVIESAGNKDSKAHVIKSHHNVGGLPENMQLKLCEPLRELFKDEVRRIGEALGLSHDMVYRHPFPGPGLAVRILGEVKPEFIPILQQADALFIQALRDAGYYDEVSQAFVVFLPVQSVGVKGDGRAYEYVVALRCVTTVDFMTAHYSPLPHTFLEQVANRIMNEVAGISRVVYDISSKPPATIEWE